MVSVLAEHFLYSVTDSLSDLSIFFFSVNAVFIVAFDLRALTQWQQVHCGLSHLYTHVQSGTLGGNVMNKGVRVEHAATESNNNP